MAITFDAAGAPAAGTTESVSWSHTISSNFILLWLASSTTGTPNLSAPTVGGAPAKLLRNWSDSGYYSGWLVNLQCWFLFNPPKGSQSLVAPAAGNYISGTSVSYYDVGFVDGSGNFNNTGASGDATLTISTTRQDALYSFGSTYVASVYSATYTGFNKNSRAICPWPGPLMAGDALGDGNSLTFTATRNDTTKWLTAGVALYSAAPRRTVIPAVHRASLY